MNILIEDRSGKMYSVRKSDIKRVYQQGKSTVVRFANPKENTAIWVNGSVEEFHNKHLAKR